jgi:hypothetical protein
VHEKLDFFASIFNPPDEDRVLDSGTLGILAPRSTKDQVLFIYSDPETKQAWDKIVRDDLEARLFFVILYETLLRGLAKRRMQALGKSPRPHISKSSPSEQVAWLKKAFDFDVTITFRLNGKDAFDWNKLQGVIEELKTEKWKKFHATTAS